MAIFLHIQHNLKLPFCISMLLMKEKMGVSSVVSEKAFIDIFSLIFFGFC